MEEQVLFPIPDSELIPLPGQLSFFPESKAPTPTVSKPRQYPELNPMRLNDPHMVRILLCIVLHRLGDSVPENWLYDMVVGNGYITYFLYTDAIGFLLENQSLELVQTDDGTAYRLTEIGIACAKNMRRYIAKPMRDRVVLTALRYAARQRALRDLTIDYEAVDGGCILCLECRDRTEEMFSLRIRTPDRSAAEELSERILRNPAAFFGKILDSALNNEEEPYNLQDN
ncbi:MAG: DUF4364 family protein [Oscillospiraceae bacterium]|nr:DUF4364 family protein [Oscillospiraceae bacterium]